MMNGSEEKTPAELVAEYIKLRNSKKVADAKFKEFCQKQYDGPMDDLEQQLLNVLNTLGVDSISGPTGTVYRILYTSVTTADGAEFRRHVIGSENWDLADWKPNKTMINELVAAGEPIPPGVNRSAFWKVGVRKGNER
jgi:hypothetical protein